MHTQHMTLPDDLLDLSQGLRSNEDPFEKFLHFLQKLGAKGFSYWYAVLRSDLDPANRGKSVFFHHSFPEQLGIEQGAGPIWDFDPSSDPTLQEIAEFEGPLKQAAMIRQLPKMDDGQTEIANSLGASCGLTVRLDFGTAGYSGMGIWFENQDSAEEFLRQCAHFGPALLKAGQLLDRHVRFEKPNTLVGLTPREVKCLGLLLAGHRASEICWKLGVSEKTLEKNIQQMRGKLKALTRDQALGKAILLGLVSP